VNDLYQRPSNSITLMTTRTSRTEEEDARKLISLKADVVYVGPERGADVPDGFATTVSVDGITQGLCGAASAGHFDGVATIVNQAVHPDPSHIRRSLAKRTYSAAAVVTRLPADLDLAIEVVGCPTIREEDGLAMSSLQPDCCRIAPYVGTRIATARWKRMSEGPARGGGS